MKVTWRRSFWAAVGVLLAAAAFFIGPPSVRFFRYHGARREMWETIRSLADRGPIAEDRVRWECASTWTLNAYSNICSDQEHVNDQQLFRLRDDLDEVLRGEVSLDTFGWIWDRLARTGRHGSWYVGRYKPSFLMCLPPHPPAKAVVVVPPGT